MQYVGHDVAGFSRCQGSRVERTVRACRQEGEFLLVRERWKGGWRDEEWWRWALRYTAWCVAKVLAEEECQADGESY